MMELIGYIASIFIGISLGMLGSGGAILTVPVLVYLMGFDPILATTSSLFIVGITSSIGGIRAYKKQLIDFRAITEFGMPSVFAIFVARHFILPAIPEVVFTMGNKPITKGIFLLILFAILMFAAAIAMIKNADNTRLNIDTSHTHPFLPLFLLGLFIGTLTGLLGSGGGFIIIPSLVLLLHLPMKKAVGTSLLLVAINSLFGFLFSVKHFEFKWKVLILFTLIAIIGLFIGGRWADKIPAEKLKKIFGVFILCMAMYILIRELYFT